MGNWADLTKVTKLGAALSFYPSHAHAMLSKNTFTSAPFRHPTLAAYYAVMLLPSVSPTLLLLVYDSLSTSSTTTTSLCLYLQRPPFYPLLPRTSSSSSYYHQSPLLFYFSSSMSSILLLVILVFAFNDPLPIHFSLVYVHPVVKEDRGRKLSSVIEPLLPLLLLIVSRIQDP